VSLKDQIASDIDNVFFNPNDFAEEAIVDGRPILIIVADDFLNDKSEMYAEGLSRGEQLVFIREVDLNRMPNIGDQITIDKKKWYVKHAIKNKGVYEVRIGREKVYA